MGLFWGILQQSGISFPTSGLTSYWRFDSTGGTAVYDSVGSVNGTLDTNTSFNSNGKNNYCAYANGTNNYNAYFGNKYNFENTDTWTISGWFKFPAGSTNIGTIMTKESTSASNYRGWGMLIYNTSTTLSIEMYLINSYGGNNYALRQGNYTGAKLNDGNWHMYTFTYDGSLNASGLKCYFDNEDISSTISKDTLTGTIVSASGVDFCIGGREQSGRALSNAYFDECAIWNRVLSEDEITALYNSGSGLFYPESVWERLTSYWRIDETSGTDIYDNKGSYDGALNSGSINATGKHNTCFYSSTSAGYGMTFGDIYNYERTNSFSFNCWIKRDSSTASIIMSKQDTSSVAGYWLYVNGSNYLQVNMISAAIANRIDTYVAQTLSTGVWYMITQTYNGNSNVSGLELYINGTKKTKTTTMNTLTASMKTPSTVPWCLGGYSRGGGLTFRGYVDESGMWNRVLSQDEVTELYNSGSGLFY